MGPRRVIYNNHFQEKQQLHIGFRPTSQALIELWCDFHLVSLE